MRKDLLHKLEEKYWEVMELLGAHMLPEKDKKSWSRMMRQGPAKKVVPEFLKRVKHEPDDKFEAFMAELDSMQSVDIIRRVFNTGLAQLPKKRGGRPPTFSLDVRLKAIQDIGIEYARCDRLADAIHIVAVRYGMPTEYLRKVWKNRRRLRKRGE